MKKLIIALFVGLFLTACSALPSHTDNSKTVFNEETDSTLTSKLVNLTERDLQSALDSAKAHNDKIATLCYEAILPLAAAKNEADHTQVVGPISAYQKARNVRKFLEGLAGDNIKIACGPLLADTNSVLSRLGISAVIK